MKWVSFKGRGFFQFYPQIMTKPNFWHDSFKNSQNFLWTWRKVSRCLNAHDTPIKNISKKSANVSYRLMYTIWGKGEKWRFCKNEAQNIGSKACCHDNGNFSFDGKNSYATVLKLNGGNSLSWGRSLFMIIIKVSHSRQNRWNSCKQTFLKKI